MFSEAVYQTVFTDAPAGMFKIDGARVEDDTLMSVLRAVLPPRMGDDTLTVRYDKTDYRPSESNNGETDASRITECIDYTQPNHLCVFSHNRGNGKYVQNLADGFVSQNEGWTYIKRVTEFFKGNFNVLCFVNESIKSTVLMIELNNIPRIHLVTCALFTMFPWYFKKEDGASEEEIALMQSLRKGTISDFQDALAVFEDRYDFYSPRLSALEGIETSWIKAEIQQRRRSIDESDERIRSFMASISDMLKEKENHQIRMHGLEWELDHRSESELKEYFLMAKDRVRFATSTDNEFTFYVTSEMTYWDDDFAQTLIDNDRSLIHKHYGIIDPDDFVKLFKAIFIDRNMKLRMCAAYKVNTNRYRVFGVSGFDYGRTAKTYLPNPHIQQYSCLGDYEQALVQMMETHNYIGVIEQCVVSAQSLNLTDTTVLERFCEYLNRNTNKYVVMPDGSFATVKEACEYLNKEDENHEQKD